MEILIIFILAYIFGSIPSALIIGKVFYNTDIREHGSGNLGGTNAFRVLGAKAGITVIIMDILKGTLAASLPALYTTLIGPLSISVHPLLVGLFAAIGHMYPLFAGFRGGKAVATSAGAVLYYEPMLFLLLIVVFALTLFISQYVSLSSMVASIAAFIYSLIIRDLVLIILVGIFVIFIIYRHRANIKRIINKEEPKVQIFKKKN